MQAIESVPLQEYKFPERSALLLGWEREGVPVESKYILNGFHILQASESVPLQEYKFPERSALLLGREREGVPVELIYILKDCTFCRLGRVCPCKNINSLSEVPCCWGGSGREYQ